MADEKFDSVEAIRKHFGKLIKDAEDADKPPLQTQQAEAISAFHEQRANDADRKGWLRDALEKHPAAKEFPELITGATQEEIEASAAKVAERVGKLTASNGADDAAAQKLYGEPITVGGGTPPGARTTDNQKFVEDFAKRWNNKEQVTKAEIDRFVQVQSGRHLAVNLMETSSRFKREGVTDASKIQ